ncbi:efflux RND transporter permease subunit, partial [Salmonella enterica subsp. enterica serovar Typhimurium]|nr:efflux RND transporter permease subunit [Salmonella enterica subsp. enterica serovar Typhimurium]
VALKPWADRSGTPNSSTTLVGKINGFAQGIASATIFALDPPPIQALGNATGFSMKIEDRGGTAGAAGLAAARDAILAAAAQ